MAFVANNSNIKEAINNAKNNSWIYSNSHISEWNVSQVTDMSNLFSGLTTFNEDISNWNTSNVTNMSYMFYFCHVFNSDIGNWNTSKVTNMKTMFQAANAFNHNVDTKQVIVDGNTYYAWNVSNVTDIAYIFHSASVFNQPLNNWNVSNVTTMEGAFAGAFYNYFNQPLNNWNTSKVENMRDMFKNNKSFDQNIRGWIVKQGTDLNNMFEDATEMISRYSGKMGLITPPTPTNDFFNQIYTPNLNNSEYYGNQDSIYIAVLEWMTYAYQDGPYVINTIITGNSSTTLYTNPSSATFDFSLSTSNYVTNITVESDWFNKRPSKLELFSLDSGTDEKIGEAEILVRYDKVCGTNGNELCDATNNTISKLVFKVNTTTKSTNFRIKLSNSLDHTSNEFEVGPIVVEYGTPNIKAKYGEMNTWNTQYVTTMQGLFQWNNTEKYQYVGNSSYNTDVAIKTNFKNFNENISNWDTSNVTNMSSMFNYCEVFNVDIGKWNTSKVTNMKYMFSSARKFNQNVDTKQVTVNGNTYYAWNVSNVTDMGYIFYGTYVFNQPLNNWNVSNVTNMEVAFGGVLYDFNQPLNNWNVTKVINMRSMFDNNYSFDQNIRGWTVRSDTNLNNMFHAATKMINTYGPNGANISSFGKEITGYTPSSSFFNFTFVVISKQQLQKLIKYWIEIQSVSDSTAKIEEFHNKYGFIGSWNVELVTDMSNLFENMTTFNEYISNWNVSNVTSMEYMFYGASSFNQDIGNWNVVNVTSMKSMFERAISFNKNISNWNTINLINAASMFANATNYNNEGNNISFVVNNVTNMNSMFMNCKSLSVDSFKEWNTNKVENMDNMFYNCENFNGELNTIIENDSNNNVITHWSVANVTSMKSMFYNAKTFNQSINNWDTSKIVNMEYMFSGAELFNQSINTHTNASNKTYWNVANVTNMHGMFSNALSFNHSLNNWNVSNVTNMSNLFNSAIAYNWSMDKWNTENVKTMVGMFFNAYSFNANINNWNTANVISMAYMFGSNNERLNVSNNGNGFISVIDPVMTFNKDISSKGVRNNDNTFYMAWDTAAVTNMSYMFKNSSLFNQNIRNWQIDETANLHNMFYFDVLPVTASETFNEELTYYNTNYSNGNSANIITTEKGNFVVTPNYRFFNGQFFPYTLTYPPETNSNNTNLNINLTNYNTNYSNIDQIKSLLANTNNKINVSFNIIPVTTPIGNNPDPIIQYIQSNGSLYVNNINPINQIQYYTISIGIDVTENNVNYSSFTNASNVPFIAYGAYSQTILLNVNTFEIAKSICNNVKNCNITKQINNELVQITDNTVAGRMSMLVKTQKFTRNASYVKKNVPVNRFGQRPGGPSGFGKPLQNSF
jgi:surface protein